MASGSQSIENLQNYFNTLVSKKKKTSKLTKSKSANGIQERR